MIERIKALRRSLGLSQAQMSMELGLSRGYLAGIETGARQINDRIIKLLVYQYGVSEEWLRSGAGDMFDVPAELELTSLTRRYSLSPEDVRLIAAYLKLKPDARAVITGLAREMVAEQDATNTVPSIRRMLYLLPVSAGNGTPTIEETGEEIDIKKTPASERADYVLRISGTSMEPDYPDGSLILVQRTPAVNVGELGIFYADGRVYFKRLGVRELISLNPEVPNIPLAGAEVITEGRVLGPAETV